MANFQTEKQVVRNLYAELDLADPKSLSEVLAKYTSPKYLWRGFHPFNEMSGAESVASR